MIRFRVMAHLPNRLRQHREQRLMTLKTLATACGSTPTHLSMIERGVVQPLGITQERIARALGVPRDELFPAAPEPQEATA